MFHIFYLLGFPWTLPNASPKYKSFLYLFKHIWYSLHFPFFPPWRHASGSLPFSCSSLDWIFFIPPSELPFWEFSVLLYCVGAHFLKLLWSSLAYSFISEENTLPKKGDGEQNLLGHWGPEHDFILLYLWLTARIGIEF